MERRIRGLTAVIHELNVHILRLSTVLREVAAVGERLSGNGLDCRHKRPWVSALIVNVASEMDGLSRVIRDVAAFGRELLLAIGRIATAKAERAHVLARLFSGI